MNYEEMSDNEINEMVADLIGGYAGNVHGSETKVKVNDAETNGIFYTEVDYCNNPYDAWPIITSNSIAIFETAVAGGDVSWVATTNLDKSWLGYGTGGFDSYHKNPLRAAMIVFLMMQEKAQ